MIAILILFVLASLFFNYAKKNNLNPILWAILAIVSFFAAQVIAGVIIALFFPNLFGDDASILAIGLISSLTGVFITYNIMRRSAQKAKTKIVDAEVLDDNIKDDLDSLLDE